MGAVPAEKARVAVATQLMVVLETQLLVSAIVLQVLAVLKVRMLSPAEVEEVEELCQYQLDMLSVVLLIRATLAMVEMVVLTQPVLPDQ
jgi:hypothetical protein